MSQTLQTVAVIGAGTMGAGIAEVAAAAGHPVLLYDIAAEALTRAVEGIRQRLAARVARGKLTADQADALVARLVPVTELAALSDAWLVIEAASERPDVKSAFQPAGGDLLPVNAADQQYLIDLDYRHCRRCQAP
jgi:3-hydroxybutyryl-CoA dehydrogenase